MACASEGCSFQATSKCHRCKDTICVQHQKQVVVEANVYKMGGRLRSRGGYSYIACDPECARDALERKREEDRQRILIENNRLRIRLEDEERRRRCQALRTKIEGETNMLRKACLKMEYYFEKKTGNPAFGFLVAVFIFCLAALATIVLWGIIPQAYVAMFEGWLALVHLLL